MFNRLPPDNYPDDYETRAYQRYHPNFKPGVLHWLLYESPRLMLAFVPLSIVATAFLLTLLFLPERPPRVVVVTSEPQVDTLQTPMPVDFPVPAEQQQILNIPARVDHELGFGERHAYRFWWEPGFTWTIRLLTVEGMVPVVSLYNPQGLIIDQEIDTQGSYNIAISYTPTEIGQYAVIVETSGGVTAGGYTLTVMPQR